MTVRSCIQVDLPECCRCEGPKWPEMVPESTLLRRYPPPGLRVVAGLVVLILAGCYSYHEVPIYSIQAGTEVRVQVTAEEANRLASSGRVSFGVQGFGVLEGDVLEVNDASMVLSAALSVPAGSVLQGSQVLQQHVRFQFQDVIRTELRELDHRRTYLAIGAAGLLSAAVLIHKFSGSVGGSTLGPGTGPPPESRGPFPVSFPLGGPRE